MKTIETLSVDKALQTLQSSKKGLTKAEVAHRRLQYGENRLVKYERKNKLGIFLGQFKSVLILILIVAAIVSVGLGFLTKSSESFVDAAVILAIVALNAVIGFFQENKAENALEALEKMSAPQARVLRDGKKTQVSSIDLVPGDIIFLEVGDRVPADARIIENWDLHVNESALTGESVAVGKNEAAVAAGAPLGERSCMIFMSTLITRGRCTAMVSGTGMRTQMGKIADLIQHAPEKETPLQKKLGTLGRKLGVTIIIIAAIIFVLESFRNANYSEAFLVAVSLAVAAVPEGLPAVITIALALGLERMAKRKAVVRNLPAVETLGATTIICSDKTGTLTRDEMTVREIYRNGKIITVSGRGYEPEGDFAIDDIALTEAQRRDLVNLLQAGALCNNAELVQDPDWGIFGDPTEGALVVAAHKAGMDQVRLKNRLPRAHENEFNSDRKCMSTIHASPKGGFLVFLKGAPEVVLEKCTHFDDQGKIKKLTAEDRARFLDQTKLMAGKALRILAIAHREIGSKEKFSSETIEQGMTLLGLVGMIDPPREEVKTAIATCKRANVRAVMITGDHQHTAEAIARELGMLDHEKVLTGPEIEKMSATALQKQVTHTAVFARVSPEHKVRILHAFQNNNEIVAMTGDGVNDAPALKNADIGVSMGKTGTDVAREASDMVLQDDNFTTIVAAIEEGRGIYDNIKKFINYMLTANAGEILIIFIAAVIGMPLPLIAVQILWVNLLTDGLPAVALALDPPAKNIMTRKPRNPRANILDRDMLTSIAFIGILMAAGALYLFQQALDSGASLATARSIVLALVVLMEIVRVQSVRQEYDARLWSNKYLLLALASSVALLLLVLYVPVLQGLFGTAALTASAWIPIFGVTALLYVFIQAKVLIQRFLGMRDTHD